MRSIQIKNSKVIVIGAATVCFQVIASLCVTTLVKTSLYGPGKQMQYDPVQVQLGQMGLYFNRDFIVETFHMCPLAS